MMNLDMSSDESLKQGRNWSRQLVLFEWTELDGVTVSRQSMAQVQVNLDDLNQCRKIRSKEPDFYEISAGFQTDENRYYTSILAIRREAITKLSNKCFS